LNSLMLHDRLKIDCIRTRFLVGDCLKIIGQDIGVNIYIRVYEINVMVRHHRAVRRCV
jgi:hypothetical protein